MNKRKNGLTLVCSLVLLAFTLLIQAGTTFAASNQGILSVTPSQATIPLGATQKFEASFSGGVPEALNYALFSGSSSSSLTMNGTNLTINGSTHSNRDFTANVYKLKITGSCEAVGSVTLNGNPNDIQIGKVVQHASSIAMPDISDEIIALAQSTGQTYNSSKTYNDTNVTFNSPVYVKGDLTINCNQFVGKGPIVATGNITVNSTTLSVTNDSPVSLFSVNGNITVGNSSVNLKGMVHAPNGTITMNGSYLTVLGQVIANNVVINPNQLTIDSTNNDLSGLLSGGSSTVQATWSSSNTSVATINSSGIATGVGPGTSTITATYNVNNVTYTDTATLTVVAPTLRISPASATIMSGSSQQYQATLVDSSGIQTDVTNSVTWSTSNSGVATISTSGSATGKTVGSCTITGTYKINGVNITATSSLAIVNLSITPANKFISLGSTQQYQAQYTDSTGRVTDVTQAIGQWSVANLGLTVATISQSGLATAKALGACVIKASYVLNGVSMTATTPLTVVKPSLNISPDRKTISVGFQQQYQATLLDNDGHPSDVTQAVTWSSDNPNVAKISSSGSVTGMGVGTCTITGTYVINGVSITASTPVAVVNLIINPANATISLGMTQEFKAQFIDSSGKATDCTVTWSSDNTGVATINSAGIATAKGVGTCAIIGTYSINGTVVKGTALLTIEKPTLSITPSSKTISLGGQQQYSATLTDSDGNHKDVAVKWSSSNTGIATIDSDGIATAKHSGPCTITGTYTVNDTDVTATASLNIEKPTLSISPSDITIPLGTQQQYQATIMDSDGIHREATQDVKWFSSKTNVARIDESTGRATGVGSGTCTIKGIYTVNGESIEATTQLTIAQQTLSIVPENITVFSGSTYQFNAYLTDAQGNPVNVTSSEDAHWDSEEPTVAYFSSSSSPGLLTGNSPGDNIIITATYNLNGIIFESHATVKVIDQNNIDSLIIEPSPPTKAIFKDETLQFTARLKLKDGTYSIIENLSLLYWESTAPECAKMSSPGLVTGSGEGSTIIKASLNLNGQNLTGKYPLSVMSGTSGIIREWEE